MKQVKIGEKIRKSSLDKSYDEKENEILTPIISESITVSPTLKSMFQKMLLILTQSNWKIWSLFIPMKTINNYFLKI